MPDVCNWPVTTLPPAFMSTMIRSGHCRADATDPKRNMPTDARVCGWALPSWLKAADSLRALTHRPAAIEPAFGQIALPDADIEAVVPPVLVHKVAIELQHKLPLVGAREVRRALAGLEGGPGLPRFLPDIGPATLLHAVPMGLHCRVVPVVVIGVLDTIGLDRPLPRDRNPADLERAARIRVLHGEVFPKPLKLRLLPASRAAVVLHEVPAGHGRSALRAAATGAALGSGGAAST